MDGNPGIRRAEPLHVELGSGTIHRKVVKSGPTLAHLKKS